MLNHPFRLSRPAYNEPRLAYPNTRNDHASTDLRVFLDSHNKSKSLRLADMSFGDEGARILREFLDRNKHVEFIEVRGNSISSDGFADICEGLMGNNNFRSFSAEWNNIGSGTRGMEALASFVAQNNSLETLDFRNNKLNTSSAIALANIIKKSTSLISIDLRWNDLGNHGAKAIADALQDNRTITNIDLAGNNITADAMEHIFERLKQNKPKRSEYDADRITREYQNNDDYSRTKRGDGQGNARDLFEDLQKAIRANSALERALQLQTLKNSEIKEQSFRDADLSKREMQSKIDHILRENSALQLAAKSHESDNARLIKENTLFRDKISELDSQHMRDLQAIEENQRIIRNLEQDLRGAESNYKTSMTRTVNDHSLKATELENNWDLRLKEVIRENEYLVDRANDLDAEVKRLSEENRNLLFSVDDKIRDGSLRAREEERQKNLPIISDLEIKLRGSEEDAYRLQRQLEDIGGEFERRKDYSDDKLRQANEEVRRLKHEVTINVEYFNKEKLKAESLQNEVMARDNSIIRLESELRDFQKNLQNKELLYQEQIEILKREQEDDSNRWEDTKTTLQKRIQDLEKQNRQVQTELNRLRTDMQRVSELLVTNLSQTVYKTFSDLR